MSNEFYTILTNAGLASIANAAVSNGSVNFSKVAVGDGNGAYYTPTRDMTELRRKTWEGPVASVQVDENNPNWINVEAVIPATDGGFYIREIGIIDDAGLLLAIGKLPETYKPEMESGSTKDLYLKAIFEVTNANVINLKADPSVVLASKKYVDDKVSLVSSSIGQINNNLTTLSNDVATHLADDVLHGIPLSMTRSGKDENGIFTTIEYKRANGTLSKKSVLSGGTSPKYTTRTVIYYGENGTTVLFTKTLNLSYTGDDLTSEVLA